MSAHTVVVEWERRGSAFIDHRYSRVHRVRFDGGVEIAGSSSPSVVRAPFSNPAAVDPEESFVAALSTCHMLWFLDLAATDGVVIDRYADRAEGYLTRRSDGRMWLSRVLLAPQLVIGAGRAPSDALIDDLHHRAHQECFLANAVKTEIEVRGAWTTLA